MTSSSAAHGSIPISCIICAFNEAPRIAAVLAVAQPSHDGKEARQRFLGKRFYGGPTAVHIFSR